MNLRAIDEDIEASSREGSDLGLQVQNRLLDGDIKGIPPDASIGKVVTGFTGEHSRNGSDAVLGVLFDKSLADTAPTTPGRASAQCFNAFLGLGLGTR